MPGRPPHGGDIYLAAAQYGFKPGEFVDFSTNVNAYGFPAEVARLLKEQISVIGSYPEPRARSLRAAIAAHCGLRAGEVMIGNGAAELIYLYCRAVRPRRALIVAPTFSEYAAALSACAAPWDYHLLSARDGFSPALPALLARLQRGGYDLLFLCNPNNPTGTLWSAEQIEALLAAAGELKIFIDLSYAAFVDPADLFAPLGCVALYRRYPDRLLLINSLTKTFGLPGLRLGLAAGAPQIIKAMEAQRDPWSVNALAQLAGACCLQQREYCARHLAALQQEAAIMRRLLSSLRGITVFPSAANFFLCRLHKGAACELQAFLGQRRILIRDAGNFPGLDRSYFRIAVRRRPDNQRLLEGLREYLSGIPNENNY